MLLGLAAVAGLGNSVFHPADFSILSHRVSAPRVGRGFSIHAFSGTIGYAAAPALIGAIAYSTSWRVALSSLAAFGLVVALVVVLSGRLLDAPRAPASASPAASSAPSGSAGPSFLRLLMMPVMFLAFAYLTLVAVASNGIQTFAAAALSALYDVPYAITAGVVSVFLAGGALGILAGGPIADRTTRHDRVAVLGLLGGAALLALVAWAAMPFAAAVAMMAAAGACVGVTAASRDMLVKAAAPKGATGKVFGLVYSGFDVGSMAAPVMLGPLIDRGLAATALLVIAGVWIVTTLSVVQVRQKTRAA
jgi:MFS family permease